MRITYQQLTYEQRCQISTLKKSGCSQREVAEIIGTSQSKVSSELARNTGERGYRHRQAQGRTDRCRIKSDCASRMKPKMIKVIESKLRVEWSPEHISGWLLNDQERLISYESIYLHVWANKQVGGNLYMHLRRNGKKYDKRRNGKSTSSQIKNHVSIDDYPEVVDYKLGI
ncbi:MAG: helix-turn-helix domain-containing protein [Candidatus Endonucleobacter sp. (ex Gigantidas childressi)]|nr:helix-turn-helix domain-containing protein [Candidatus Endonucleobacter sp. (ex Gigantidas childressi)]